MKDIITSREELFLAKLAGRDVDLGTMTPPVPTNMSEKLMLEAAERIDDIEAGSSGGGSGAGLPDVTSEDNGKVLGVVNGAWGVKTDESGTITVDDELSDTSENPVQNKVITSALSQAHELVEPAIPIIVPGTIDDEHGTAVSTLSVPLSDIYQAFAGGKPVYFEAEIAGAKVRFPCTSVKQSGGNYIVTYAAPMVMAGTAADVQIMFNGSDENGTYTSVTAGDFKVVFTVTPNGSGGQDVTADASISDIIAAVYAGKHVYGECNTGMFIALLPLTAYGTTDNGVSICGFGGVIPDSGSSKSGVMSAFGSAAIVDGQAVDTWFVYGD